MAGTRPGDGKETDQQEADGDADHGRATNGRHGIGAHVRCVGNVLPIIGVEGLPGGLRVTGGDDERPAIEPRVEAVRNVAGGEHHGPFVGLVALGRHADSSSSEVLHRLQP